MTEKISFGPVRNIAEAARRLKEAEMGSSAIILSSIENFGRQVKEEMERRGVNVKVDSHPAPRERVGVLQYVLTKIASDKREKLMNLFVGKEIKISHNCIDVEDEKGVCKDIHATGSEGRYDIELEDGSRFRFIVKEINHRSAIGEFTNSPIVRRKIEII